MKKMSVMLLGIFCLTTSIYAQGENNVYLKGSIGKEISKNTLKLSDKAIEASKAKAKKLDEAIKNSKDAKEKEELKKIKSENAKNDFSNNNPIGFGGFVEYTRNLNENIELGAGLGYVVNNKLVNSTDFPSINSIPVYGTAKYTLNEISGFKPYVKADLGYSINTPSFDMKLEKEDLKKAKEMVSNGLYYGIAAGAEYNNFVMDLSWHKTNSEIARTKNDKFDYSYSTISLNAGYKFNF